MASKLDVLIQHPQWISVQEVCQRLRSEGYEAYLAGGCVRDALMGRSPGDFDIATSARPDEIEKMFPNTRSVGKAFGVMLVINEGCAFEVASFRSDGLYRDGRHPESIKFSSAKEDALRRDFTINALFYDPIEHEVIDYVGGESDMLARCIRTVGLPERRFSEDRLRCLRALRFMAQLGFEIEKETRRTLKNCRGQLSKVSQERVYQEVAKLLASPHRAEAMRLFYESGLLKEVLNSAQEAFEKNPDQIEKALRLMGHSADLSLPLALFYLFVNFNLDVQKVELELERFKCSKTEKQKTLRLISSLQQVSQEKNDIDQILILDRAPTAEAFELAFTLAGIGLQPVSRWKHILEKYQQISQGEWKLPPPILKGADLKALSLPPGPKMGKTLEEVYRMQLLGKIKDKQAATRAALSFYKES